MRYAIIKDGVVDNVILAEQDFIDSNYPGAVALSDDDKVGPGYIYNGNSFIEPEPEVIIDAEEVTPTPALEG